MNRLFRAAIAAACTIGMAEPGAAQDRAPAQPVLTLENAALLANSDQPAILAYEREAAASEEAAIAARSLPDPKLTAGIQNFPITGDNAFSPTNDFMTMYTIGVMRQQVRRSKREAEAERIRAEALLSRRQGSAEERSIRRAVMIAWIGAVEARAKQKLLGRLIADLKTGREVIGAAIPTGGSTSALALQADAEIGLQEARLADAKRAESRARAELARWIGVAADRPLPAAVPDIEVPTEALPAIGTHPVIQVAAARQEVARRQVALAREERKPDLSWSVALGIRPEFGNMVSAGVSIPLQLNRRNRQDRLIGEARERATVASLRLEDTRRELERDYRVAIADYQGADAEIAKIERDTVPALEAAFAAAEARYAGGGGTLDQPFEIVRRYVDAAMQSVDARARRARAAAEILYVLGENGQ